MIFIYVSMCVCTFCMKVQWMKMQLIAIISLSIKHKQQNKTRKPAINTNIFPGRQTTRTTLIIKQSYAQNYKVKYLEFLSFFGEYFTIHNPSQIQYLINLGKILEIVDLEVNGGYIKYLIII